MKSRWMIFGASFVALSVVAGCGGQGGFEPTRGEGSIPIGKVQSTDFRAVELRLTSGGTQYTFTPTPNGTVYAPSSLATGSWTIKASLDGYWTEEFSQQAGPEVFDVVLLPISRHGDVTSVVLDHPTGIQLRVGETLKLKPIISGPNTAGIKPTYWVDGDVGSINPGGVFKARNVGSGSVTVDVLGISATAHVTILP
jgi:hypothetical protein